jgi:DNA-binding transcriptional ArsR family regulator
VALTKLEYLKALRGHKIPHGAYRVLVEAFNYTDKFGENAHPGERRLAEDTGMAKRTMRGHLKWLTENGYLIKGKRGHGSGGVGFATVYAVGLDHIPLAELTTAEIPRPTGEIPSSYRQNYVDPWAESRPLSDPLSDPVSDHEHAEHAHAQDELLDIDQSCYVYE